MVMKTWTGSGSDSNYFNNANWSPLGVPAENGSDDVLISGAAPYNITVSADTSGDIFGAGHLTLTDPNLNFSLGGNTFNVAESTTFNAGTISIADGQLFLGGAPSTFGSASALTGYGVVFGEFSGSGTLRASGPADSTLEIADVIGSGSLDLVIGGGNDLQFDSAVGAGNTVTFQGNSGVAILVDTAEFQATVSGLSVAASRSAQPSDHIVIADHTGITGSYDAGNNQIVLSGGDLTAPVNIKLSGSYDPEFVVETRDSAMAGTDVWLAVCFAEGTRILTDHGEVPVEALAPGDVALTAGSEPRPIRWIGQRRIDLAAHPRPELAAPVRIHRDAFDEGRPHRDLLVSPDHCLLVDGKLIPAKLLINGMTIVQDRDASAVTYYHVELDRHAALLAEGLPAESYLDTGNRAFFSNTGLALVLHPEFHVNAGLKCWEQDACAPLAVSETAVKPIWQALASRAQSLGKLAPEITTTNDPDLRLLAYGRTFRPVSAHGGRFIFVLPAGFTTARIKSRATAPAEVTPWLEDWRRLGVAVGRIVIRAQNSHLDLPVDHPALGEGWHDVETEGRAVWRWTDGDAALPIHATDGPVTVELHVRQQATYVLATLSKPERRHERAAA